MVSTSTAVTAVAIATGIGLVIYAGYKLFKPLEEGFKPAEQTYQFILNPFESMQKYTQSIESIKTPQEFQKTEFIPPWGEWITYIPPFGQFLPIAEKTLKSWWHL